MLYLYYSNHLENLAGQFAELVNQPLNQPFASEKVVVQNSGMARWLSLQVADRLEIAANYHYLFPAEFMWELLRGVVSDVPEKDPFAPPVLVWKIFKILSEQVDDFPELFHYLKKDNDLAAWELASQLAGVLDQYLFFRPQWISEWESGKAPHWQARLWQRIANKNQPHWLHLQTAFTNAVKNVSYEQLPERVIFFSVPMLSSGYLRLLGELAQKTDVHMFMINPCLEYWGDIESEKTASKKPDDEKSYITTGNNLLASLGKQGRDFLDMLQELPQSVELESWVELPADTALHTLQGDILTLQDAKDQEPQTWHEQDDSIQIHSCHTAMREVEVLHDQILAVLQNNPDLSPADMVVMTPDIATYAPYIEAVFISSEQQIPFSIADRNLAESRREVELFLKLLDLPQSRFDAEAVFSLLEYPEIHKNFDLDLAEIEQCKQWLQATDIRWGIDAESRNAYGLNNVSEHSWKHGLDRMLLGYAMPGHSLFAGQLPYNDIEGSAALLLSHLKSFTDIVFRISSWLNQSLTIDQWIHHFRQFVTDLYSDSSDLQALYSILDALQKNAELGDFSRSLSFPVIQNILKKHIQNQSGEGRFLNRGITFCAMVPMRSVPFRFVALIGMNDHCFPRQDKKHSFDLMAGKPERGDRSHRNEDRYLFLESMLAARDFLYISYTGQNVYDNAAIPPSTVVSELFDYLQRRFAVSQQDLVIKHPLQAFSPRYYQFNHHDHHNQQELFSYVQHYAELSAEKSDTDTRASLITTRLPELDESHKRIRLDDFLVFYKSPARTLLKKRLAIEVFENQIELQTREPFELEPFVDRELRQLVLAEIEEYTQGQHKAVKQIAGKQVEDMAFGIARAKGLLPYGEIGDVLFKKEQDITTTFYNELPELIFLDNQTFTLEQDGFQLSGIINSLTEEGRVTILSGKPWHGQILEFWIYHVILNVLGEQNGYARESILYSPEETIRLMPIQNPKQQLGLFLNCYWQGLHQPLHFFPKASFELLKDGEVKINNAVKAWEQGFMSAGEGQKAENLLLYKNQNPLDDDFVQISEALLQNLFIAMH
jgi:exodeoxyribonuclease V gamma subunit